MKNYKIAVAGTGYVGLSLSVLLAQHNQVTAVDIVQAKVDMINNHRWCLGHGSCYYCIDLVAFWFLYGYLYLWSDEY